MSNKSILIREIIEITEQYKNEVPGKRRQWPKAIQDRAMALRELGMTLKEISEATGLSYHTINSWMQRNGLGLFREIKMLAAPPEAAEVLTGQNVLTSQNPVQAALITLTTPKGYKIEGIPVAELTKILGGLQ